MKTQRQLRRHGYSLLETLAAGAVMAIVLVPSYEAMRRWLEWSRDAEALQTTSTLCVSKMEERMSLVAVTFTSGTQSGDFAADGFSDFRFHCESTDNLASGGIPDRLMVVTTNVWKDEDGDGVLDQGEITAELTTKVAKMTTYVVE